MKSIIKILIICFALLLDNQSYAGFTFAHKNATVKVGSSTLFINTPISSWNGTLEQHGAIVGKPITFNQGVLDVKSTPAFFSGDYDADAARQITLNQNGLLRSDAGSFTPKMDIIRGANRLEGSPLFSDSQSINLAHHLSDLTIAIDAQCDSDIALNNGSVTLGNHLSLGDDRTFTGSGRLFLNGKRLSFGGTEMVLTHTIDFINASDIILNSYLSLSGVWTFSGSEAHVAGNGNILDLSSGGTIWVKAGTQLFLTDIKIKGLGSGYFVFEDDTSQIHLSDAQIEMNSNYTITQGGIYVDGDTTIVTKDNVLTFDGLGTLTVDGVTLWYDTTIYPNMFNIQTGEYSQDPTGSNIATINDGRIATMATDDCCRNNSNAIINIINNSQLFPILIIQNSNAIVSLEECCRHNSNAIVVHDQEIVNNSNAIVSLKDCCINNSQRITNNSNAIVNLDQRVTNNSNAIISLAECCANNSNAIGALKCCTLADAPLVTDQLMTCNCIIDPVKQIRISANLTIDGQGAWIMFSDPDGPEFIIDPGVTVRLKDVSLLRLTSRTFQFGEGSKLEIEGVVVFEMHEDLFFVEENIEVVGDPEFPSLFIIRGMGGQRNLFIEPLFDGDTIIKTWNINFNALVLQNVEFFGVESIQATEIDVDDVTLAGQVALAGQATVNLAQDTDLSFGVEDDNNRLILLQDNLVLNNFIVYSPFFESTLHLKFQLPTLILGNPVVAFADDLLFLSADIGGKARLIFDDYWATVFNLGINSFVTDINSFISGRNVEIVNFPIKQSASDLLLDSTLILHTVPGDLPNAIETAFIKSPERVRPSGKKVTSALLMMRKKLQSAAEQKVHQRLERLDQAKKQREQTERFERERREKEQQPKPVNKQPVGKKRRKKDIEDAGITDALISRSITDRSWLHKRLQLRDITLPSDDQITLKVTGPAVDANQLDGTVVVSDGSITNFGVTQTGVLNLFMLGGATLVQGEPTPTKVAERMMRAIDESKFVALAATFVVDGTNNKLVVTQDSNLNGAITLAPNSRYTIEFDNKTFAPELLFRPTTNPLTLPDNSRVEFKNKGTVWLNEGFGFALTSATIPAAGNSGQRTTLAFSENVKAKFKRQLVDDKLLGGTEKKAVSTPFTVGTKVTLNGTGAVRIDTGAQMLIEKGQHLLIGGTTGNNIALSIERLGVLSVDSSVQSVNDLIKAPCDGGTISMYTGTYSIDVDESAILNIGCEGCFGINWDAQAADGGEEKRGTLTQFTIKNRGVLNIERSGRLIIGRNAEDPNAKVPDFGTKFLFDSFGGIITGQGIVALGKSGFAGRLQPVSVTAAYVTAQQFVRLLINTVPALQFATVFINESGQQVLYNKMSALSTPALIDPNLVNTAQFVVLQPGDVVCSDDINGNVFGFNKSVRFVIKPDGTRING